jgi:hypothetical protein
MMSHISKPLFISFALTGLVALYALLFFDGADAHYRLWYYTPAALVVGSLISDRFTRGYSSKLSIVIDIFIAAICICRPLFGWPAASGHAIFFVYGFLTAATNHTRVFAMILGAVTLYAKIWLWHWDMTLWPGLIIGLIAGYLYRGTQGKQLRTSEGDKPNDGMPTKEIPEKTHR